jgi:hypothetical protein
VLAGSGCRTKKPSAGPFAGDSSEEQGLRAPGQIRLLPQVSGKPGLRNQRSGSCFVFDTESSSSGSTGKLKVYFSAGHFGDFGARDYMIPIGMGLS